MHDWLSDPRPITVCLNEWRNAHGWTWAAVADEIGEKLTTVQQWGKAGREPSNSRPTRIIMTLIDSGRLKRKEAPPAGASGAVGVKGGTAY